VSCVYPSPSLWASVEASLFGTAASLAVVGDQLREHQREVLAARNATDAAFDRARDRGLLRRDVNEMLETITLEALA
jgi:hypothetical protein